MAQLLKITKKSDIEESSKDEFPIIFDADSKRFICCDKNHAFHEATTINSDFPISKNFNPPDKPEQSKFLTHNHGRTFFKISAEALTDEYISENGAYMTIFSNKIIRGFKKPLKLFEYLKEKSWITLAGLNNFRTYNFLRRGLLKDDEKQWDNNSSQYSDQSATDPRSRALQQKNPRKFDDKKIEPKFIKKKNQKLQARRLKDARFAIRIHNFRRKKLKSELKDLKIKNLRKEGIPLKCKHCNHDII